MSTLYIPGGNSIVVSHCPDFVFKWRASWACQFDHEPNTLHCDICLKLLSAGTNWIFVAIFRGVAARGLGRDSGRAISPTANEPPRNLKGLSKDTLHNTGQAANTRTIAVAQILAPGYGIMRTLIQIRKEMPRPSKDLREQICSKTSYLIFE